MDPRAGTPAGRMQPRGAERFRRLAYRLGVLVFAALPWYVAADAAVFCLTTHVPPPEALAPPAAIPPLS
jgi:hypothetical protein